MSSENEYLGSHSSSKKEESVTSGPSTAAPFEEQLPSYQTATNGAETRTFHISTSSVLHNVTISGPETYSAESGFGPTGTMKLHRGTNKGEVLSSAHFSLMPKCIRLCEGDGKTAPTYIEIPDTNAHYEYPLTLTGRALCFRCEGWLTTDPFRLVDDQSRVILAEFVPGRTRQHTLHIYDISPEVEKYVLLMAAVIAVRVGVAPMGPPMFSSYWKNRRPYYTGQFGLLGSGQ